MHLNFSLESPRRSSNEAYCIVKGLSLARSVTDAFTHTFVLSVFETIFFWAYITKQEDTALRNHLRDLEDIITALCSVYPSQFELPEPDNSNTRDVYNKDLQVTSYMLVCVFFLISFSGTILCSKFPRIKNQPEEEPTDLKCMKIWGYEMYRSVSGSLLPITIIGLYEVFFFQTVVKLYRPISSEEIYLKLITACL